MEIKNFKLENESYIDELKSKAYLFRHEKTGAELVYIPAKDDNKLFGAGFKTIPTDDTGVPHIVEHTTLCASKKYPLKELFGSLDKYSLNTFINAMTYPDTTMYPVASRNHKDFSNLVDVYLDCLFNPTIVDDELTFRQEGHSFDFTTGEPVPSGIVYNEMKGAMSSAPSKLEVISNRALFDNVYACASGGIPESVLDLKYEDFLAFYRKHYHPANARFFVFGDADIEHTAAQIDEVISPFGSGEKVPEPAHTEYGGAAQYRTGAFDSPDGKSVASISFVIGSAYDLEDNYASKMLANYLFDVESSPVKKALIESGFASDVDMHVDTSMASTVMIAFFYGLEERDPKKIEERVFEEIKKVGGDALTKGIKAAYSRMAFGLREMDTDYHPLGMEYMIKLFLHNDIGSDPFRILRFEDALKKLEKAIDAGEHMGWIDKFILKNNHRVTAVLVPETPEETENKLIAEKEDGQRRWNELSEAQQKEERKYFDLLRKKQEEPDDPEIVAKLPKIKLSDIEKDREFRDVKEEALDGFKLLSYEIDRNIIYLRVFFPFSADSKELPLIRSAVNMLGAVDTENYSQAELDYQMMLYSGGMKFSMSAYEDKLYIVASTKTLPENLDKNIELIKEVMLRTKLTDSKRFEELISQSYTRLQNDTIYAGNSFAEQVILGGYLPNEAAAYYFDGLGYYDWMKSALGQKKTEFSKEASELYRAAVTAAEPIVAVGSSRDNILKVKSAAPGLVSSFAEGGSKAGVKTKKMKLLKKENSAFVIPAAIQFVGMGAVGEPMGGHALVMRYLLANEYLWNEIRMKGGAYGARSKVGRKGEIVFVSYRDPNLDRTIDVYKKAADYVENYNDEIESPVISAVRMIDAPMSPSLQFEDALRRYFVGLDAEAESKYRTEALNTNREDLKAAAAELRKVMEKANISVLGGDAPIRESKLDFDKVEKL